MLVRRPVAALLALSTSLVGLSGAIQQHAWPSLSVVPVDIISHGADATEPYAWPISVLLPPIGIIVFRAFRRGLHPYEQRSGTVLALACAGVFLGILGAVYTLHFGFAGLFFVALAATVLLQVRRTSPLWQASRVLLFRSFIIGIVALPFVLLVWTPYLIQGATQGWPGTGAALRFLPEASAFLPFPMLEFSVLGIVSLIGFGWLLLRFRTNETALVLGVLVLSIYGWFVLSALVLAANFTLLPLRLRVPLSVALVCAGVFGVLEGARAVLRLISADARRPALLGLTLLAVIAATSIAQAVPHVHRDSLNAAYRDYYPRERMHWEKRIRGWPALGMTTCTRQSSPKRARSRGTSSCSPTTMACWSYTPTGDSNKSRPTTQTRSLTMTGGWRK